MTALWNDATCRVGGKAATCRRSPKGAVQIQPMKAAWMARVAASPLARSIVTGRWHGLIQEAAKVSSRFIQLYAVMSA